MTTFSLIQELIHRDGLKNALAGRDDVLLEPVLRLLLKHVTDPRFGELVCDVARVVIGEFSSSCFFGVILIDEQTCINPLLDKRRLLIHCSCGYIKRF
jgi:U3 small nucleolar RNA-associated protein 15